MSDEIELAIRRQRRRTAMAGVAHRAKNQLCAGPHCTNRVSDEEYYAWMTTPAYVGGPSEPCCSQRCGFMAYLERITERTVTDIE